MKLSDWLIEHRYRKGEFAKMIGVTGGFVTQLCDGTGRPSMAVAERIYTATGGEVTANDFMRLEPQEPPQ